MKSIFRIAALVSLLFCCLYMHATATVSGTIKDPSGAVVPNSFVRFELANTNNGQCSAGGSSLGKRTVDFNADLTTGAVSGTLYRNDTEVSCAGSFNSRYNMTIYRKGVPDGPSKCVNVTASFDISAPQFCSTPPPVANPAQYVTAAGTNSFTGPNTFSGETHFAKGLFYDVKGYGATCNGVADDTAAFNAAATAATANFALFGRCGPITVPNGSCRVHEVDLSAFGSCAMVLGTHVGSSLVSYNGAGGAGSYIFKFGGLSFGGVSGLKMDCYSGTQIAQNAIVATGLFDAMATFDHNTTSNCYGDGWALGSVVNAYMRHNRWDGIGGYPISFVSNNTGNGFPVHISDFTSDNNIASSAVKTLATSLGYFDGTHWGKGFLSCTNCSGIRADLSDGRLETNMQLINVGNADNGYVYETGASGAMAVTLSNVTIVGNTSSKVAALSETSAGKITGTFTNKTDISQNMLGAVKDRATGNVLGIRQIGAMPSSVGALAAQSRGFSIEDQRIDNIPIGSLSSNVTRWNCGDWNIRPSGELTATTGPIRIVTAPCPGYSRTTAASISTAGVVTAASATVSGIDPQALEMRQNDNITINGAGVASANLNAIITAVDYVNKTITVSPTPSTSVNPATIVWQAATFTDYALDATRASSIPGGACTSGQIRWNSNPTAGTAIGWFCASSAWVAGPNVPSAGTSASTIYNGFCSGTATSSTTLSFAGLGAAPASAALPCNTGVLSTAKPVVPSSGTLSNLTIACGTGGVNASSGVFTIFDNGSTTGITCTTGTGTTCSDTTHTASVAAGDRIDLRFTTQGTETLANCVASFQKN